MLKDLCGTTYMLCLIVELRTMKNKTVIHIIDSLDIGGAQEILYSLSKYIKEYRIIVVTLHGKPEHNYIEKIQPYAEIINLSSSKYNLPLIIFRLVKIILKNKDAIFNLHLEVSSILGSLVRIFVPFKMVVSIHAHPSQIPKWKNFLFYTTTKIADYYIAEDKDVIEYLRQYKVNDTKIKFIPIGSEKITFAEEADKDIKKEFDIPQKDIVLLNIARMVPAKGQYDLLIMAKELCEHYPDFPFHVIIVGYGPEHERLINVAKKYKLEKKVIFAGKRTDLHNFYAIADWFLMPCYDESMGVVIYEALGYRVPVIAYNSGSIGEVILDEEMGFLIEKSPKKMADVIATVSTTEMKNKLKKKDLSYFTAERMVADYVQVYESF